MPLSWSEGWLSIDGEGGAEYIPENNGAGLSRPPVPMADELETLLGTSVLVAGTAMGADESHGEEKRRSSEIKSISKSQSSTKESIESRGSKRKRPNVLFGSDKRHQHDRPAAGSYSFPYNSPGATPR